jgi:MoaA/NifB/PqqE/SkfB family radical SAM enzyme
MMRRKIIFHLGYSCNFRCRFCYFRDSYDLKDYSLRRIKFWLYTLKKLGFDNVDFHGGEPTVRGDIFDILRYSKKMGYEKISMNTNGYLIGNEDFFVKCVESGLNDVTFSLLGSDARTHDSLTQTKGSFSRLMKAIEYAHKHNLDFGLHYLILADNYKTIRDAVDMIIDFKPKRFEFLYYVPGFDITYREYVKLAPRYSDVTPFIVSGLERLVSEGIHARVDTVPFCVLPDYKKNITNYLKMPEFTQDEGYWIIKELILKNPLHPAMHMLEGISKLRARDFRRGVWEFIRITYMRGRIRDTHVKAEACRLCEMDDCCSGLWKEYAMRYGTEELKPIRG